MRRFVLAMLSLFLLLLVFGCASTRSTSKGKLAAESQLTATTEGSRRTEDRTTTNTTATTGSNEKQNIVIEFTKVEYYPEGQKPNRFAKQFQKADSAFNEDMRKALEMANGEPARKASETAEGQSDTPLRHNTDLFPAIEGLKKPPNVKSLTTGRIVINGDKQKNDRNKRYYRYGNGSYRNAEDDGGSGNKGNRADRRRKVPENEPVSLGT